MGAIDPKEFKKMVEQSRKEIAKEKGGAEALKRLDKSIKKKKSSSRSSRSRPQEQQITIDVYGTGPSQTQIETTTNLETGLKTVRDITKRKKGSTNRGRIIKQELLDPVKLKRELINKSFKRPEFEIKRKFKPTTLGLKETDFQMTQAEFNKKLRQIDQDKTLNIIQKEQKKRKLLGIQSGISQKFIDTFKTGPTVSEKKQFEQEILKDVLEKQLTGALTKKTFKEPSKFQKFTVATKELTPVINSESWKTWGKIKRGDKLNSNDYLNLVFDIVSVIPVVGGAAKAGAKVTSKFTKNALKGIQIGGKIPKLNTATINRIKAANTALSTLKNIPGAKAYKLPITLLKTSVTIADDVGFIKRVKLSGDVIYNVDKQYLDKIAKKTNLKTKNSKQLYNKYIEYVGVERPDNKLIRTDDVTGFIGVDYYKEDRLKKSQKSFRNYLKEQGLSSVEIARTLKELESYRHSRLLSQILGAVKVEVSSERLGQQLIKKGFKTKSAVGLAGAREAAAEMLQETLISGYDPTTLAVLGNLVLGTTGAQYFSQIKFKKLTPKQKLKAEKQIINDIFKRTSTRQKNAFLNKAVKESIKNKKLQAAEDFLKRLSTKPKQTPTKIRLSKDFLKEIKTLKTKLSPLEKETLIKNHIRRTLTRKGQKIAPDKKQIKLLTRHIVGNVIDPYELIGDTIYDIQEAVLKKINRRLNTKYKKLGVKTITVTKTKAPTKTTTKTLSSTKTKLITKTRGTVTTKTQTKVTTDTKTNTKTETKTDTKTNTRTNTQTKTNTETKTNTKTNTLVGTKTEVNIRIMTIPFPWFNFGKIKGKIADKQLPAFNLLVKRGNKYVLAKRNLPINKALSEGAKITDNDYKLKEFIVRLSGKTAQKDIKLSKILKQKFNIKPNKKDKIVKFIEKDQYLKDTTIEKIQAKQISKPKPKPKPKKKPSKKPKKSIKKPRKSKK